MAKPEDLGRYRLKRLLGRGALGEVWEASDLEEQGARVALKIMHAADDELAAARIHFARDARLAALVRHPHVAAVRDAGEAAGTSFMVMDMIDGASLRRAEGKATVDERLRWLRQIAEGLAALHRADVVHRDLKPDNVVVRSDGSACVVDLGMAKWTTFDLGAEPDPLEDAEPPARPDADYAPPEALESEVYDELGDQYAWGVLAYELLTGALPAEGSPPLTEREDVPRDVAAVVDRARSPSRAERFDAMELLLVDLGDALPEPAPAEAEEAAPPGPLAPAPAPAARPPGRSRALAAGLAVALVVLAALVVAALR